MSLHLKLQPWTFTILLNVRHLTLQRATFFSDCFALGLWLCSQILLRHCPWRNFQNKPVLGDALTQVSPFYRESALRTLQNAHFCREEVPHDEGQLFAMYPKKFPQVSPIDRAPQLHFSTLEKTKIDHNPLLNNLVAMVSQVSPIYRHLQQIFQDLDIHTRSSPGLMRLKKTRTKALLRSNSSWVAIWLWHVLFLILFELVVPSQRCKL